MHGDATDTLFRACAADIGCARRHDAHEGWLVGYPGRDALVLSVAPLAKDEVSLDPISDLVGRFSGLYADWDEAVAELAERQGRRGCELATEAGLLARPLAASGKTAPTILRTADEHDACAIVLGAVPTTGLAAPLGASSPA
jgi:nucleotide-binding universal stress UspA family protein